MGKISTSTAAKKLGITPRQVARLCKAGKLNAVRPHDSGWWQVDLSPKKEDAP